MITYSNEGLSPISWHLFARYRGSVIPKAMLSSLPSMGFAIYLSYFMDPEDFKEILAAEILGNSLLWAALGSSCWFLLTFRISKAYSRFWDGTTLLHQMFGEWFDAASNLVAFSTLARTKSKRHADVDNFRHTLARLMSLCHASALEEIALATDHSEPYPVLDIGGLDTATLKYLVRCKFDKTLAFNRVEVILHMIQTLVVNAHDKGVLAIPPPILSRVFQTLSRGQVNLANCKKMTSTLFPFPIAQLEGLLMLMFSVVTPIVMTASCKHVVWTCTFSFIPVFASYCLNYVARELEMPFGLDPNDLPLETFQHHMNNSLLMLIREETDLIPRRAQNCVEDWEGIFAKTLRQRPRDFVDDSKPDYDEQAEQKLEPPKEVEKAPEPPKEVKAPPPAPAETTSTVVAELKTGSLEPTVLTLKGDPNEIRDILKTLIHARTPASRKLIVAEPIKAVEAHQ